MPNDPESTPPKGNQPPRDLEAELLTEQQRERVADLVNSGQFSRDQALLMTASRSIANRIIGARNARRIAEETARSAEERRAREARPVTSIEDEIQRMRETFPSSDPPDEPKPPTAA